MAASEVEIRNILASANRRLGFGCGEIYAKPDRKGTLRLLETAIDSGITYFDTARLYGHGDAEYLLGELMPRHRSKITLTSKAGILPTTTPLGKRIRDKAAIVARTIPALHQFVPAPIPSQPIFGVFGTADLRRSIDTSLRALRTDHLDLLLLHDCSFDDANQPEIVSLLDDLRKGGKIRGWGVATDIETTRALAAHASGKISLFQFSSNAWNRNVGEVKALTTAPLITHSVLGERFRMLVSALREDQRLRMKAIALGIDPDDPSCLAQRLVAAALCANPDGLVLFSTSKPERIRSNMQASQMSEEDASAALALVEYSNQLRNLGR